jgi:POT family proton-dependent oligopeptide transporter
MQEATEEEINSLRHVVDELPRKVWISLLVGGAERFTFYVVSTPWREYVLQIDGEHAKLSYDNRELHAE